MCRSGCATQDCGSYGACLRNANIQVGDIKPFSTTKPWDHELKAYKSARNQGIQPASTKLRDTEAAVKISEAAGHAFDAGKHQVVA